MVGHLLQLTVFSMCNVFSFALTFGENGRTFGQNGRKMADDQLLFIALFLELVNFSRGCISMNFIFLRGGGGSKFSLPLCLSNCAVSLFHTHPALAKDGSQGEDCFHAYKQNKYSQPY